MSAKRAAFLMAAIFLSCVDSYGQPTLTGTIGGRAGAMGNCGYSLSDDETSLFYNPAGLGLKNDRWNSGAFYISSLSYDFGFNNDYYGLAYQNGNFTRLGFSGYWNRFSYGNTVRARVDSIGNIVSEGHFDESEFTGAIGCGFDVYENAFVSNSVGLAMKYYRYQTLVYNDDVEILTGPIILDVGYILQIAKRVRIGFVLRNMGPDITGRVNDSTRDTEKLPFTIAAGFGYKDAFDFENLRVLDLCSEFSFASLNRGPGSTSENSIQTGIDLQFFRIFSAQFGYSLDLTYNTHSISWGTGFSLFNHFEFNFVSEKITAEQDNFVNTGVSTSFKRMLKWSAKDRRWWLD